MKTLRYTFLLVLVVGCFGGVSSPEGALKNYVETVSSNKADKDFYIRSTAGKLLEKIESMSDEEFSMFNNFSNIRSAKVKVIHKSCEADNCTLTYIVNYKVFENNRATFDTEVKKIAEMVRQDDSWKITEVRNRKTFIESNAPIEVSNKK